MATFHELSTSQLRQALQLREQIESLQQKLSAILGGKPSAPAEETKGKKGRSAGKRTVSAEARAKIAAAQHARWAKVKGAPAPAKATAKAAPKKAGGLTKAGRAKTVGGHEGTLGREERGFQPERHGRIGPATAGVSGAKAVFAGGTTARSGRVPGQSSPAPPSGFSASSRWSAGELAGSSTRCSRPVADCPAKCFSAHTPKSPSPFHYGFAVLFDRSRSGMRWSGSSVALTTGWLPAT